MTTPVPIAIEVQPLATDEAPAPLSAEDRAALIAAEVRSLGRGIADNRPLLPTLPPASLPTSTPAPVAGDKATDQAVPGGLPLAATADAATATVEPSPTAMPTATLAATATASPIPTATPIPIDVVKEVNARLPVVLFSASFLLLVLVIATGIAIVRGPRDI
jgi:hypothetical protein